MTFHLLPRSPPERIFTKLGTNVPFVDVVNCDKFCDNLFKGLNFTGGQSSKFSHWNLTSPCCDTAQPVIDYHHFHNEISLAPTTRKLVAGEQASYAQIYFVCSRQQRMLYRTPCTRVCVCVCGIRRPLWVSY